MNCVWWNATYFGLILHLFVHSSNITYCLPVYVWLYEFSFE